MNGGRFESASSAAGSETMYGSTATEDVDFIDELKNGMPVLLHVKVGKLEPASLRLDEETGKLVVKTNREGWRAICHCHTRHYELGKDELEPVPRRMHTRQLNRSISVVNGGDTHLVKTMLQRSLSLLRRFPTSESIDLTFATAETEERLRLWAQNALSVKTAATSRQSSQHIMSALTGCPSSEASDNETAVSEDPPRQKEQQHQQEQQQEKEQEEGKERDLPPALPRSASVHPAQQQTRLERRHSLNPFKGQSHRMAGRRESTGSDRYPSGGGGGGGGGMETSSVGSGSGGGGSARGRRVATGRDFEDDGSIEHTSWSWKEPPVLRRMESSRSAGRSRSRPRGMSSVPPGESYPTEESPKIGRVVSMSTGMDRRRRQEPEEQDFWDPLGLMANFIPQTPRTAKAVPSRQRSGQWDTPKTTPKSTPKGTPTEPRGRKKPIDLHTE